MTNATDTRPLFRTTDVRVAVTCPTWCVCDPEEHVENLENIASCEHLSAEQSIADSTTGPGRNPVKGEHSANPATLRLAMSTYLDGNEMNLATIYLNGAELSVPQAAQVAEALAGLVEQHRAAGSAV